MKDIQETDDKNNSKCFNFSSFIITNKFPIIITIGFFLSTLYVAMFHHIIYSSDVDGVFYLNYGREILSGNGENLQFVIGTIGGPILFASLEALFHDIFTVQKIVAVLCGTGIVFVSFFLVKQIFGTKVALLSQLFIAVNPRLNFLSFQALNELVSVFLIILSLFWITKKQLRNYDFMIIGSFLGIAAMFRLQSVFILIAIIIFILVHNKKIRQNLSFCFLTIAFFLIAFSPQIYYGYSTHDTFLDSSPVYYILHLSHFQTDEWREEFSNMEYTGLLESIFVDFDLFQKNYFYNLLFHSPNKLFNFDSFDNLSIFPAIPLLGLVPFIGGLVYCLKIKITKINLIILVTTVSASLLILFLLGDIEYHSFLVILTPIIGLTIFNIRNINKNFIPLLILPAVFISLISIAHVHRAFHFLPVWLPIIILSSVFFIEVLPKIINKNNFSVLKKTKEKIKFPRSIISLVIVILILNSSFYYVLVIGSFYNESYDNLPSDLLNIFSVHDTSDNSSMQIKIISDILSRQPNIENSYVMATIPVYSFYSDSKFVYADFTEGVQGDTLNDYISKKNWSPVEIFTSTVHSYPTDRYNKNNPFVEYLIYSPYTFDANGPWYEKVPQSALDVLLNPKDPKIPSNFELLYRSNVDDPRNIVVYKIHEIKD